MAPGTLAKREFTSMMEGEPVLLLVAALPSVFHRRTACNISLSTMFVMVHEKFGRAASNSERSPEESIRKFSTNSSIFHSTQKLNLVSNYRTENLRSSPRIESNVISISMTKLMMDRAFKDVVATTTLLLRYLMHALREV